MRIPWIAAAALIGASVLSACAGAGQSPAAGADAEGALATQREQKETSQCEPGREHWRAQGAPIRGGVVKREQELPHLDATAPGARAGYHLGIYEYLVRPRACTFADTTMAPNLARSWEVSPDGLTWTIKLKEHVAFQDKPPLNGRRFTSADVAWTIDYLKKESDLKSYWEDVTHQEPDASTVVLTFKQPDPDFIFKLGDERQVMLPHEIKEQFGDFKRVAVGTGAFQLKEFRPNQSLTVERNPNYYETGTDGRPLPYLDEIQGVSFADSAALVAALRAGLVDHTHGSQIRKFESEALQQANPKHKYYADPAATIFGLWMNPQTAPWNDARVRRAVSLALNRDDIIASDGGGAVYQGFVPQALGDFAWPLERVKQTFSFDLPRARQLLAEAGFVQGEQPYTFATGGTYAQQLEVVAKQLDDLGIKTTLVIGPGNASGPIIRAFENDLTWGPPGGGRFADYWVGDLVRTGAGRNVSRFSDPALDALIDRQKREMNPDQRKQIVDHIQEYMVDQMPYVPAVSRVYYGVLSCRVKNMFPNHNSTNYYGFEQAWIDEAGC